MNRLDRPQLPSFADLEIPFPVRTNPRWSAVQEETKTWAVKHGLIESKETERRFNDLAYARLVGKACPDAEGSDLELLSQWITFLFVLDDQQDNAVFTQRLDAFTALQIDLLDILVSKGEVGSQEGHLQSALADLCRRTSEQATSEQYGRLIANMQMVFNGQRSENLYRLATVIPSVHDFIAIRRAASTVHVNLGLIELCADVHIPSSVYEMSDYQELINSVADVTCWCNDIWSAERDHANRDPINYVTVLQDSGLQFQEAVDAAVSAVRVRVRENLQAEGRLLGSLRRLDLPKCDVESIRAAIGLGRNWLAGATQWYREETARLLYHYSAAPGTNPEFVSDLL